MSKEYYTYILTNKSRKVLYTGVTNNLNKRLDQHFFDSRNAKLSFAGKYNCIYLVYYEQYSSPTNAIAREKEIKKWRREKKIKLVESIIPNWEFLNDQLF